MPVGKMHRSGQEHWRTFPPVEHLLMRLAEANW
jgi:hypothetical protein